MKKIVLKFIYFVLANYARKVIREHNPFVIAITGSAGKTTTKEAIAKVLEAKYGDEVRKTAGNLNAEIGIPLTILGYKRVPGKLSWLVFLISAYFKTRPKSYPKFLVLEMGVEHKGDIEYFGSIVRPDIGVITGIAPVHLVNFKDFEALKAEKIALAKILKKDGRLIINADDAALAKLAFDNTISIGIQSKNADYQAKDISVSPLGTTYRIETVGQKIAVRSKLIGEQFIYAQLFGFAAGKIFDIQSLKIKNALESLVPLQGRMNLIEGKNQTLILDDTYNANPASVHAALTALNNFERSGRKVLIMGNMNELGSKEKEAHDEVAEIAMGICDLALFAGPNAGRMAAKFKGKNAFAFQDRGALIKSLDHYIRKGDIILIKASQNNNYFEEVTKVLMKEPKAADDLLVRQSRSWMRKK
ncbi:MAG: UDP-N-acetylmuramoyl-tripeptide--D-alanyl-D-alanine ligase [Patescibacteria group bacterium]